MYGTSSMETPPERPAASGSRRRPRYRITDKFAADRHTSTPAQVLVEVGDIAEAIGPWFARHDVDELHWMAISDLQEAALRGAPTRVYAHILGLTIQEVRSDPDPSEAPTHEPAYRGAHLRSRDGRVWSRDLRGRWRTRQGSLSAVLTWDDLQNQHGPLHRDPETVLLEQLAAADDTQAQR